MTPGVLLVAVGCLFGGGWLWWHREAPKTTTALFLAAGAAFGTALAHTITASPLALLIVGVGGLAALALGGWLWWLDGGRPTDTPAVAGLLGAGGFAVCTVAAHLTQRFTAGPWSGLTRLVLVAAVLVLAAEVVVKGMWKGRARPRRWHPALAFVLPTVAITVGVPVVAPLMTGLGGGLGALGAALTSPTVAAAHTTADTHPHPRIGATR